MPDAILALDLATHLGWAAWRRDAARVRYGSHQLPKGSKDLGPFFAAYNTWLRKALKYVQPDAVCFELPFVGGKASSQALALRLMGLAAMTEFICFDWGLEPKMLHSVNTNTMVKHFTGGGGKREVKKALVIARCKALGWNPANDDEADALGLLDYYMNWFKVDATVAGALFRPEPPATILAAG